MTPETPEQAMGRRKVTHEMAREAYFKLHNHVYNRHQVPLLTVPPNENDVDEIICDYIRQQEQAELAQPQPVTSDAREQTIERLLRKHFPHLYGGSGLPPGITETQIKLMQDSATVRMRVFAEELFESYDLAAQQSAKGHLGFQEWYAKHPKFPPTSGPIEVKDVIEMAEAYGSYCAAPTSANVQDWMKTEMWNFAHAAAVDLELPLAAEQRIHWGMEQAITVALRIQGKQSAAPPDWRKMCIVELAVENQSVSDYVEHWEGRTLKAESERDTLRTRNAELEKENQRLADAWMQDEAIGITDGKDDGTVRPSLQKTLERIATAESRVVELESDLAQLKKQMEGEGEGEAGNCPQSVPSAPSSVPVSA